jgi:hypothetical protein
MNIKDIEPGTFVEVVALKTLVVGRNNRAAVRKATTTIAKVTAPIIAGCSKEIIVKATVEGMGDTSTAPWNVEIVRVVDAGGWTPFAS